MDLLTTNDPSLCYPKSWYTATAHPLSAYQPLNKEASAEVCVVGAGYTGLSCALSLAEAGRRVIVLEAARVGFGASGRNGGQLGSGQRVDQQSLETRLGRERAAQLWSLGEAAKTHVKTLIARHKIDCALRPGVAHVAEHPKDAAEEAAYAAFLADRYGYTEAEPLDAAACQALCRSPLYQGGMLDWGAAHLHPLRFAQGLARAASDAGAIIHEKSRVRAVSEGEVRCDSGVVRAEHIVLAGNGYLGTLSSPVARRVMPINNYILATEPLGDRAAEVLTQDVAVADSRFVVNYFRLSEDKRLLFGGGESYGYRFPADIAGFVRKPMLEVFPHLKDVKIDYAWGGTLAITLSRLPHLVRLSPRMLSASGYSGHGVGTATYAGHLMAQAIMGTQEGFDTMAALPSKPFPGGAALRSPLLALGMTWYALRDRLGF